MKTTKQIVDELNADLKEAGLLTEGPSGLDRLLGTHGREAFHAGAMLGIGGKAKPGQKRPYLPRDLKKMEEKVKKMKAD